jgi:phage terminase small subunit
LALTKKQRAFIVAYCEDPKLGQADAARKAGFSVKRAKITAHELMRNPDVKREIDRQLANKFQVIETKAKTGEVTRESLCQECDEVIEQCTAAGAGAWQMQSRLKAIELKAKLHGLMTEKVEFGLDEKLMELLEAGRKRAGLIPTLPAAPPPLEGELIAATD